MARPSRIAKGLVSSTGSVPGSRPQMVCFILRHGLSLDTGHIAQTASSVPCAFWAISSLDTTPTESGVFWTLAALFDGDDALFQPAFVMGLRILPMAYGHAFSQGGRKAQDQIHSKNSTQ